MIPTFDTTYQTLFGQYLIIALILLLIILPSLCYIDAIYKAVFPTETPPSTRVF
jgi:hypothetical protein